MLKAQNLLLNGHKVLSFHFDSSVGNWSVRKALFSTEKMKRELILAFSLISAKLQLKQLKI